MNKKQFSEWVREQDTSGLICRDLLHRWAPLTAAKIKGGFTRTLVCDRCTTQKTQTLDRQGYVLGTKYSYAPTYPLLRGHGQPAPVLRAAIRLDNIRRSLGS